MKQTPLRSHHPSAFRRKFTEVPTYPKGFDLYWSAGVYLNHPGGTPFRRAS